jgi:hypothetical protein
LSSAFLPPTHVNQKLELYYNLGKHHVSQENLPNHFSLSDNWFQVPPQKACGSKSRPIMQFRSHPFGNNLIWYGVDHYCGYLEVAATQRRLCLPLLTLWQWYLYIGKKSDSKVLEINGYLSVLKVPFSSDFCMQNILQSLVFTWSVFLMGINQDFYTWGREQQQWKDNSNYDLNSHTTLAQEDTEVICRQIRYYSPRLKSYPNWKRYYNLSLPIFLDFIINPVSL